MGDGRVRGVHGVHGRDAGLGAPGDGADVRGAAGGRGQGEGLWLLCSGEAGRQLEPLPTPPYQSAEEGGSLVVPYCVWGGGRSSRAYRWM